MTAKNPNELLELMKAISQRCHGVEWVERNEYRLYFFTRTGIAQPYGGDIVTEQEVLKLHRLSAWCDGWWGCDQFGYTFYTPIGKWVQKYKKGLASQSKMQKPQPERD